MRDLVEQGVQRDVCIKPLDRRQIFAQHYVGRMLHAQPGHGRGSHAQFRAIHVEAEAPGDPFEKLADRRPIEGRTHASFGHLIKNDRQACCAD